MYYVAQFILSLQHDRFYRFKNLSNVPGKIHNIQFSVCVAEDAVIIMIEITNEWVTKHVYIQSSRICLQNRALQPEKYI